MQRSAELNELLGKRATDLATSISDSGKDLTKTLHQRIKGANAYFENNVNALMVELDLRGEANVEHLDKAGSDIADTISRVAGDLAERLSETGGQFLDTMSAHGTKVSDRSPQTERQLPG